MKVKVGKIGDKWFASCNVCCDPLTGFYSAGRWWLCLVWARLHVDKHKQFQVLRGQRVNIDRINR